MYTAYDIVSTWLYFRIFLILVSGKTLVPQASFSLIIHTGIRTTQYTDTTH